MAAASGSEARVVEGARRARPSRLRSSPRPSPCCPPSCRRARPPARWCRSSGRRRRPGRSLDAAAARDALGGLARDVVEVRRRPADDRAEGDDRVDLLRARRARRTTSGISHAPGTRTTVMFSASAPWRTSASSAPSTRRSTMKWLKRLATMREPRPCGNDEVAFDRSRVRHRWLLIPALAVHRVERHALDDVEPEAVDAGNLTRVVRQQADLVQPEVDQHLRAQAELAQRRVARRARSARAGGVLVRARSASSSVRTSPRGGDVDERPAPRRLDLRDRLAQVPPAVARRRREESATVEPVCTRQSGGALAVERRPSRARGTAARRRCASRRRWRATRCRSRRGVTCASDTRRTRRSV